jgi:tRNA(fMet)-specific endonuclease VapC
MAYLFDTNIVIEVLRGKASPYLLEKLAKTPAQDQFISTTTIGELVYGAYKYYDPPRALERLSRFMQTVRVKIFGKRAAYEYGRLKAELAKAGLLLERPDLQIAAIALVNKLTLVTHDVDHFARIKGLRVEDWG